MIVVIDASAAYDLLSEGRCAQRIVGAQDLVAPDLITAELLNARWKVARSHEAVPAIDTILEFLDRLRIVKSLRYAEEAALLADRLGHPVYDCVYVAVAQQERAKLLTLDKRLSRKLRSAALAHILR